MSEGLKKGGCILLVDDEEGVRTFATRVLQALGYEVVAAMDGVDGLEKYTREQDRFCLVILDVVMPRMDGREAFEQIRALSPQLPVLFTSGVSSPLQLQDDLYTDFLPKPFRLDQLKDKLRLLLKPAPLA